VLPRLPAVRYCRGYLRAQNLVSSGRFGTLRPAELEAVLHSRALHPALCTMPRDSDRTGARAIPLRPPGHPSARRLLRGSPKSWTADRAASRERARPSIWPARYTRSRGTKLPFAPRLVNVAVGAWSSRTLVRPVLRNLGKAGSPKVSRRRVGLSDRCHALGGPNLTVGQVARSEPGAGGGRPTCSIRLAARDGQPQAARCDDGILF